MSLFTNTGFWRDLIERAVATFAQALAAVLIADGTGILDSAWVTSLSVAGMAALLSVLKGVGAYGVDSETGASALTSPPPRVKGERGEVRLTADLTPYFGALRRRNDRGQTDVVTILAIVVLVLVILLLVGVI